MKKQERFDKIGFMLYVYQNLMLNTVMRIIKLNLFPVPVQYR